VTPPSFASEGGITPKVLEEARVRKIWKSTPMHADTGSRPVASTPTGTRFGSGKPVREQGDCGAMISGVRVSFLQGNK